MTNQPNQAVIVCRSATEPLRAGSHLGYNCAACKKGVQMTPTGEQQLLEMPNVIVLCNPCGFALMAMTKRDGKLGGVTINPAAKKQIDFIRNRGNN
jgi:hypothetical protein